MRWNKPTTSAFTSGLSKAMKHASKSLRGAKDSKRWVPDSCAAPRGRCVRPAAGAAMGAECPGAVTLPVRQQARSHRPCAGDRGKTTRSGNEPAGPRSARCRESARNGHRQRGGAPPRCGNSTHEHPICAQTSACATTAYSPDCSKRAFELPILPINTAERASFAITPASGHASIRRFAVTGVGACNLSAGCAKSQIQVQLNRSVYFGIDGDAHSQFVLAGDASGGGGLTWACGPRDVQPLKMEWLPANCRAPVP